MKDKAVLARNLKTLCAAYGCEENASKFTRLINERAGEKTIERSYIARILKDSDEDPANISLKKISGIAYALGISTWQLLSPSGFDSDGRPRANEGLNDKALTLAINYGVEASKSLKIEKTSFITEVVKESYDALCRGEEKQLGFELAKIARRY